MERREFADVTHNEILETVLSREELNDEELILEVEFESSDDVVECNEK